MIKIKRTTEPSVLAKNAGKWLAALLSAKDDETRKRAESKYRHKDVRAALESMCHDKCAYCESKVAHISYAHIEHYRPKSRFPDRTFSWDNLLLTCGICNGPEWKGDRFPDAGDGGPFADPCEDDPTDHFRFVYDPVAKLASVYGSTARGVTTERELGLNRGKLRKYRSTQVRRLAALHAHVATEPEARRLFDEALRDDAEYAAFARSGS